MLIDASVARSFAVLGWTEALADALGGSLFVAHGILGLHPGEPSELLGIRNALQREATTSGLGSGRSSKALAAVHGLDHTLSLGPPVIQVLVPDTEETELAARLISPEPTHRDWRRGLGLKARRLDAGEAVSIAIAHHRRLGFASDDEQALIAFTAITRRSPSRTLDLIKILVASGTLDEDEAREAYRFLQEDDLHLLGGPDW